MGKVDYYRLLYVLQDTVLDVVFSLSNGFYLTGGTALNRFYQTYRYSDDLDFFTQDSVLFKEEFYEIKNRLKENNIPVKEEAVSRDFIRVTVQNNGITLKVDFVNDRVYRYGKSKVFGTYRIDNLENTLANKVGAVIDRDEAKDIADTLLIVNNYSFQWDDILKIAEKKQVFELSDLITRLSTFPPRWLDEKVAWIGRLHPEEARQQLSIIANDITVRGENTIGKGKTPIQDAIPNMIPFPDQKVTSHRSPPRRNYQ